MIKAKIIRAFPLAVLAAASMAHAEDRLTLTANGSTLSNTDGGGGGSLGWLHNFNPDVLAGVGVQYQTLGDATWKFGSLNAAVTGGAEGRRWSLYGEAHVGDGEDRTHEFDYRIFAIGGSLPLGSKLSLQLDDRQIDVDTADGNLPKLGLNVAWSPRLQTTVSYSKSISGNLGTEIGGARLDYYPGSVHLIGGIASGRTVPEVINQPGLNLPPLKLREGFLGFGRAFSRSDVLLLADYLELGESERFTVTLSYTLRLNQDSPGR